jgi:hypothetical protein
MMQAQVKPSMGRSFHLSLMVFIAALVLYGFSHTVDADVINPPQPQPVMLYIHATVFTSWLLLVIIQTALAATRNLRLHRRLGLLGLGFGVLMIAVGISTISVMGKVQVERLGPDAGMFIYRPIEDIVFFAAAFGLAMYWRRRPDLHRRLIVLAACAVTPPGISRIPGFHSLSMVYLTTDLLVMAAVLHDLVTTRRFHPVYRWGLAIGVAGQSILLLILSRQPAPFVEFARFVTQ